MAFRGQHEHNLDSKDRITVPASHRGRLAEGIVVMAGVEDCVEVWPKAAAEAMEEQFLNPLNQMGARTRRMRRRFFGTSAETELDSAGRIRLPQHLIEHAGLEGSCLLVGVGDHLEIWDRALWEAESEIVDAATEEMTEELASQTPAAEASG